MYWIIIFIDLAENSVEDCKQRYRERRYSYGADFFPLDCAKVCFYLFYLYVYIYI